jgi:RNAse (barnase) inhibitor barstar
MAKRVYEIDGRDFATLEEFLNVVSRVLIPEGEGKWGSNLDAFNDILRGGFGTPEGGFILHWKNSHVSHERLGYPETVRRLERIVRSCHPSNTAHFRAQLESARSNVGPTVFDLVVGIIREHGPGGAEQEDGVELILD